MKKSDRRVDKTFEKGPPWDPPPGGGSLGGVLIKGRFFSHEGLFYMATDALGPRKGPF